MKRCTRCNHIETDDALNFCRADGTPLVRDSGTDLMFGYAPLKETETRALTSDLLTEAILATAIMLRVPTASTKVLATQVLGSKEHLSVAKWWRMLMITAAIALTLTLAGEVFYFLTHKNPTHKNNDVIGSLAVLPFLNVNADQRIEYLTDGMTETLICNLSQLPELTVKARASVFRYKGKHVSPRQVGNELNVQAILNGRVTQHGESFTLSLELSDARTENIIWSEQFSRAHTDLVSLQSEVARDVLNKLRVKLSGADARKLAKTHTTNTEAYQFYLKGRFHWNQRTLKDLDQAIEHFSQAIALDPNYALAYAGLADTYVVLPFYRNAPVREAMPPAQEAALKALSLDSELAEAHATLGHVYTNLYDFTGAEREYQRAIELNPNYATAHHWYGIQFLYLARYEESFAELRRALELDPLSLIVNLDYAESLFYSRHYHEAIAQLKKTLDLNPEFTTTYQRLTKFYLVSGNYAEAARSYAAYRERIGETQDAALIRERFAQDGWQGFLRAITAPQQLHKLSGYELVIFQAALGERQKALTELEKHYEVFGPLLKIEPLLDPLRQDARFAAILRRSGLPQ